MLVKALLQKLYNTTVFVREYFISVFSVQSKNNVEQRVDTSRWELAFMDDFDGDTIDDGKWMTHYYWGTVLNKKKSQAQNYVNSTLSVSDSCLYIKPQRLITDGWYYLNGQIVHNTYTVASGMIHSGDYFKQKYGVFSIRCRLPKGNGALPAVWLLDKQSYPPKIDVFNFDGGDINRLEFGLEWGLEFDNQYFHWAKHVVSETLTDDFHIFTCQWEPNCIRWYLDNRQIAFYCGPGIPQSPMYLVINLALSKSNGDYNSMTVDWIKVWKLSSKDRIGG